MADGLLNELATTVEHLIGRVVRDMFGPHGGGQPGMDAVRWEGMSNTQLAVAVRQLSSGPGAGGIQQAADALNTIANNLQQLDNTLHAQLQAIGVNWQSEASELAQEMTTESAAYSASASGASGAAAAAVTAQGDAFTAARNAVPNPSELTGATDTNQPPSQSTAQPTSFINAAGAILTGHADDHSQTVARSNAARQQTIDALHTYTANSQSGLSSHQPLPPPPAVNLRPAPPVVDTGGGQVTTTAGYVPPPPTLPGGAPAGSMPGAPVLGGGSGLPGLPAAGSGGLPGLPTVGTPGLPVGAPGGSSGGVVPPSVPGLPGSTPGLPGGGGLPGVPGGGLPGGGTPGGTPPRMPVGPGPVSGIGSPAAPASGISAASSAASGASGALIEDAAVGSAIVGGTVGAGVGGASARKDELIRTRDLVPNEPESTDARSQAARALAELEGEEAAEAGVSARIGATAEPPPTLLEPAVGGHREEDQRHSNRYAQDDEMFGDDRMVVPPVLDGGEPGDFGPRGSK